MSGHVDRKISVERTGLNLCKFRERSVDRLDETVSLEGGRRRQGVDVLVERVNASLALLQPRLLRAGIRTLLSESSGVFP